MFGSLRNRLIALFLVLVVAVGAGTLYAIERTLANDLEAAFDTRLSKEARAVADWLAVANDPRLAPRLAAITGARITIVGADEIVQGDSLESAIGNPIHDATEVDDARRDGLGRAVRVLDADRPRQYMVAVRADHDRVIRLAIPLGEVIETRARMRDRLLFGFGFGLLGALLLSWLVVRALTRPIQAMTRTAERLARGEYDVAPPAAATHAGGEFGVLARALMTMAGEVKAHVGELTQQRDLLSVVFAGLVEGVIVVDRAGKIALANEASWPLIGSEKRELPAPLASLVATAMRGDQADDELELVGRTVRASARPLGDVGSAAVIVVLYDVTQIRALEAVRREFLSNAAHELRTPVTSIAGYAETLLSGAVDAETSKEFLSTIQRNAMRISEMVSDLVLLDQLSARDSAVAMRLAVPIAEVVGDAARTTKGVAPSARIDVDDIPSDLVVLGTRDGLDHVVQNLIDNAVKYGGGTPVKVCARRVHDTRVRLEIEDAGPGIPNGHEERVFERFYRLDSGRSRDRGGSGLGLAIVKSQVDALGGKVWVEHANPGARFVVELDAG